MELANVSREVAEEALAKHKEVWLAVDALMECPVAPGTKLIPPKPKVNTGLTSEQEALCQKGRWLQDQINVVFSVAHSKTRNLPLDDLAPVAEEQDALAPPPSPEMAAVELPVAQSGSDERNPPPIQQSESPL
jgi:hypothetical protein